MAEAATTEDLGGVVRLLVDLVRDQARVLAAIAEGVAVGSDRAARVTEMSDRMADVLTRLEAHLAREEAANALARAQAETGRAENRAALTRLLDAVRAAVGSDVGSKVLQTLVIAILAWAGVRYGLVVPGPAASPAPAAIVAPAVGSGDAASR